MYAYYDTEYLGRYHLLSNNIDIQKIEYHMKFRSDEQCRIYYISLGTYSRPSPVSIRLSSSKSELCERST